MPSQKRESTIIKKTLIFAAWLILLVYLLYIIAGFWLAPRLIQSQLTQQIQQNLGGTFSVNNISFNPFNLTIKLDQPILNDLNQKQWLSANSVIVDMDLLDLLADNITVSSVIAKQPVFSIQLNPNGELTQPLMALNDHSSEQSFGVLLKEFNVNNGSLTLQYGDSAPLSATHISLQLNDVSNQDFFSSGSFELKLAEQGKLKLTSNKQQADVFAVNFEGHDIPAKILNSWLEDKTIILKGGSLSSKGQFNWKRGLKPSVLLNSVDIKRLELSSDQYIETFLPLVEISNGLVDIHTSKLSLEKVKITGGQTRLLNPTSSTQQPTSDNVKILASEDNTSWSMFMGSLELLDHNLDLNALRPNSASQNSDLLPEINISSLSASKAVFPSAQSTPMQAVLHFDTNEAKQASLLNADISLQPLAIKGELEAPYIDLVKWQSLFFDPSQIQIDSGSLIALASFSIQQDSWQLSTQLSSSNLAVNSINSNTHARIDNTSQMHVHIDSIQKEIKISCFDADSAQLKMIENINLKEVEHPSNTQKYKQESNPTNSEWKVLLAATKPSQAINNNCSYH